MDLPFSLLRDKMPANGRHHMEYKQNGTDFVLSIIAGDEELFGKLYNLYSNYQQICMMKVWTSLLRQSTKVWNSTKVFTLCHSASRQCLVLFANMVKEYIKQKRMENFGASTIQPWSNFMNSIFSDHLKRRSDAEVYRVGYDISVSATMKLVL